MLNKFDLFDAAIEEEHKRKKEEQMEKEKSIKISSLELENVKRVKAVKLEPSANGLTILGGDNANGKTSVLDAIAWALGGNSFKPSNPKRDGSLVDPYLKVTLSNGIVVERKGKSSSLKVTDPKGNLAGQKLLDAFISQFALNLPKFLDASEKEKADILLQIIGVGDQLKAIETEYKTVYADRTATGRLQRQKKASADEMVQWDNVPEVELSVSDLIKQQQDILAKNGENELKRRQTRDLETNRGVVANKLKDVNEKIEELKNQRLALQASLDQIDDDLMFARKTIDELRDESTTEIETSIANIEAINAKVAQNLAKEKAEEEAEALQREYDAMTDKLAHLNQDKIKLLNGAKLPLEGLSVDDGVLTYKGQPWEGMSSAEQLVVATSIVKAQSPQCGFVLMDKLEQMDLKSLKEFGKWAEKNGMQIIATRVSRGDECSIYIEDGYSIDKNGNKTADTDVKPAVAWKAGEF